VAIAAELPPPDSPQVYQLICLLPGPAAGTKSTLRSTRLL
jgi:hypothetical protein